MMRISRNLWVAGAICVLWSFSMDPLLADPPSGQKSRSQRISPYRSTPVVLRSTTRSSRRRNRQLIVENSELGETEGVLFEKGDFSQYERGQLKELEKIHALQKHLLLEKSKLNIREKRRIELDIRSGRIKLKSLRYIRNFPYSECMDTMDKVVQELRRKDPGGKYSSMSEKEILLQIQKEQKEILTDLMKRRNIRRKAKRRW